MTRLHARGSMCALIACLPLTGFMTGAVAEKPDRPYAKRLEELRQTRGQSRANNPAEATKPIANYIDNLLAEEWKALKLVPASECTDGEFIRRASLDLIGRIPTINETNAFLSDRSPNRRGEFIDRLISSEEFGRHLANIWTKLLVPSDLGDGQAANRDALHAWLEREFNRNRPWNEIVFELLTATGRWDENPAVNFLLANQENDNTLRVTANMTRLFLGVQTQCTECHDHPWNEWKQEQFHGLNAFFVGTREERVGSGPANQQTDYWMLEEVPYKDARSKGVFFERRNGLGVFTEPKYLDGRDLASLSGRPNESSQSVADLVRKKEDADLEPVYLRRELAKVMTGPDNPYFARAMVNRIWHQLFGHSFTKNVDDFDNGVDDPAFPDLMDRLADDFKKNGHDLHWLVRSIASTNAYGAASKRKGKETEESIGLFAFQLVRPMSPEQLFDSVRVLTDFEGSSKEMNSAETRQRFVRDFMATFSTDEIPTGSPTYDGTITQGLMMMNSPLVHQVTSCTPGSFLHELAFDSKLDDKDRWESLYLAGLCRKPTGAERKIVQSMFASAKSPEDKAHALADVLWAILNSAEFALNH